MKIGILTFQDAINFGAQLQCLAMQEILKVMGHQPQVIQLEFSRRRAFYRGIGIKKNGIIKAVMIMISRMLFAKRMRQQFVQYKNKYLNLSPVCTIDTIAHIANQYDAIITGSDQIWGWSGHSHATYFIGWEPTFPGRRISYAPCCAKNQTEERHRERIANLLHRYDHISVRNQTTYDFVNQLTGIIPPIVADPTFLISFDKYISQTPKAPYSHYIVAYIIGNEIEGGHSSIIKGIRQEIGNIPVISIVLSENSPLWFSWADKTYRTLNPIDWLNLLYYSSFVYTDSFHASVFALKFHKRFIAYYAEEARASRFIDMASRYNLSRWIITDNQDAVKKESYRLTPDFASTDKLLQAQIHESLQFLQTALASDQL